MKKITFYEIDGGDRIPKIIGYASDEATANYIAKGNGFYGDAGVRERTINVYESIDEYKRKLKEKEDRANKEDRERALSKLTQREKELLGLY